MGGSNGKASGGKQIDYVVHKPEEEPQNNDTTLTQGLVNTLLDSQNSTTGPENEPQSDAKAYSEKVRFVIPSYMLLLFLLCIRIYLYT